MKNNHYKNHSNMKHNNHTPDKTNTVLDFLLKVVPLLVYIVGGGKK